MKIEQATQTQAEACASCSRVVRAGQWFATKRLAFRQGNPWESVIVIHIKCMRAMVDKAGADVDNFASTQARVKKTRKLFPDE